MTSPLPPGPYSLPFVGSLPFLDLRNSTIFEETIRLSKELDSDVISLRVGSELVTFLLSADAIEEAFRGEDFPDRPKSPFFLMLENKGLIGSISGDETWRIHRLFFESLLKDSAADFEVKVHEEVGRLKDEFRKKGTTSFNPHNLSITLAGNIMAKVFFSKRFEYDDEKFVFMGTRLSNILRIKSSSKMLILFPSLRHLMGDLFGWKEVQSSLNVYKDFVRGVIDERRDDTDSDGTNDFVAAYLAEMKRGTTVTLTDEQIIHALMEVFMAGTEDVALAVRWAILCILKHPDVQEEVQREIDDNIDKSAPAKFEDRSKLPYTHASILEIQRWASQTPALLPHANHTRDVNFRGYTIPKGTTIIANSYAVHRDPKVWKFPDVFNPRNFLDDDGNVVVNKRGFMPQSLGKRMCPGFNLVQMELFVIFASLMQAYEFTLPGGATEPSLEAMNVGNRATQPYEICVTPRF